MHWLVLDARKRYTVLVGAALTVALLLGWTAWTGLRPVEGATLRPIRYGDSERRNVALTFDVSHGRDGVTSVLAELKTAGAPATFFVTGEWARQNADLARKMVAAGHSVEASGREYLDMSGLSREQATSDLDRVKATIGSAAGAAPAFFRPPGGKCSDSLLEAAITDDLIPVTWTVDSQDWRAESATAISRRVSLYARPGTIILMHAGDESPSTAASLVEMVKLLRKAGLEPVTLRALLTDEDGD